MASATSSLTLGPRADLDRCGVPGQRLDHIVVHRFGHVDALDGRAHLAVVVEGAGEDRFGDGGRIGVIEDDGGIVAAQLQRHPLEIRGGRHGDLLAGFDRAGEADLARYRVAGHPGAQLIATADHVEHARRQDVTQQLPHLEGGQRGERRWFQDHGVAGQKCRSDLPEGQGEREVPWRDGGHDTQRAAGHFDERLSVVLDDLGRCLQIGEILTPDGGGEDLDAGIGQRLALLRRQERGQVGG